MDAYVYKLYRIKFKKITQPLKHIEYFKTIIAFKKTLIHLNCKYILLF